MRGVYGVCCQKKYRKLKEDIFSGLWGLQHRGQKYCGVGSSEGESILLRTHRGRVAESFSSDMQGVEGFLGIGSTSDVDRQPISRFTKFGEFLLCFDGYIMNADNLRIGLMAEGHSFASSEDVEILASIIAQGLDIVDGIEKAMRLIVGPCSLVLMTKDVIYAARGIGGCQPLILGKNGNRWAVASESSAFNNRGSYRIIRDVEPGEIIRIDPVCGVTSIKVLPGDKNICCFERIYFGREDSIMEGMPVVTARHNLGKILASREKHEIDLVGAVFFSAFRHGEGYAIASGKPFMGVFVPPRYSLRTYNITDVGKRIAERQRKLVVVKSVVKGKRVVLVDDSIRSSITMDGMVKDVRNAGASEVHVRIASPKSIRYCPNAAPPKKEEDYIARNHTTDEICQIIGADSLEYVELNDVASAIGTNEKDLCLGCFLSGGSCKKS